MMRFLRGGKMRTVQQAMDEFAAALQFPWYYGDNLDAFWECLRDLYWLRPFSRIVLVIFDAPLFLAKEAPHRTRTYMGLLVKARDAWLDASLRGEREYVDPVPFSIIFQVPTQGYTVADLDHLGIDHFENFSPH
ncbi:barstar family protein [Agreia pratensis]|nr:barstar family protein [Agreia pratensis]